MKEKLVSVVLPAYNSSKYIEYTVDSLLNQTYRNIEIIIINDGSNDDTMFIINNLAERDKRIKVYDNGGNFGLSYTTNRGIKLSNGEYIVQADHDDLSLPNRIELCYNFLENNKEITGVSGRVKHIGSSAKKTKTIDNREAIVSSDFEKTACEACWGGIISNPTIMYRKSITESIDECYNVEYKVSADMDFFEKTLSHGAKWVCLDNVLIEYRRHRHNTSRIMVKEKVKEKHLVLKETMKRFMKNVSDEELDLHVKLACRLDIFSKDEQVKLKDWFIKLIVHNQRTNFFNHEKWLKVLAVNWRYACALSNIYSPFNGYKMYHSIFELENYLSKPKKYFYEWQKRFFRALSWKIEGKKWNDR